MNNSEHKGLWRARKIFSENHKAELTWGRSGPISGLHQKRRGGLARVRSFSISWGCEWQGIFPEFSRRRGRSPIPVPLPEEFSPCYHVSRLFDCQGIFSLAFDDDDGPRRADVEERQRTGDPRRPDRAGLPPAGVRGESLHQTRLQRRLS